MEKAKILAVVLSATMVFTSSSVCFAAEGIDGEQIQAEATAELVEDITGTEDINKDIEETSDGFEVEGEGVDITLPEDGDGNIVMDSEEESIGMGLPKEVQDEEGILTDEGTVIYGATQDVSVAVQAGEEELDGVPLDFIRELITIDSLESPKEYSFAMDLPEGYSLVKAEDYYGNTDYDYGKVYVVDNNNKYYDNELEKELPEIMYVFDEAWARDANGDPVETSYKINNNELIQIVNFNENTVFPVVADPAAKKPKDTLKSTKDYTFSFDIGAVICANTTIQLIEKGKKKLFSIPKVKGAIDKGTKKVVKVVFKDKAEDIIKKKVIAKLGSKFIPGLNAISIAIDAASVVLWVAGYDTMKLIVELATWKHYVYRRGWTPVDSFKISDVAIKLV